MTIESNKLFMTLAILSPSLNSTSQSQLPSPGSENPDALQSLLLTAMNAACKHLSKTEALDAIDLSLALFAYWFQLEKRCELKTDLKPCPKTIPSKLTNFKVEKIKSYILDEKFFHFSINSFSLYPTKNHIGIRTTYPNQY